MFSAKSKNIILISFVVIGYIIHLVFNGLAGAGTYRNLFPNTTAEASKAFQLEITPIGATFSIWGVIFFYQILWILFAVSTIFRNGDWTSILSKKFYFSFLLNILFITIWLFLWARIKAVPTFIVIVTGQIFLDLAIYFAVTDLKSYLDENEITSSNKVDIWCQRILVQNGLLFYASWTTVATLINTAIVFAYELGASTETASIIVLSFLTVIVLAWYLLENFAFENYTEYTFTAYIGWIWGLSGIFANIWGKNDTIGGFVLGLLILTIIMFISRVVLIVLRSMKNKSYENIGYDANKQTVNA